MWAGDEATSEALAGGVSYIDLRSLPLSADTIRQLEQLCQWYQGSLNWEYPPDPGPWRQEECDRFNAAVHALLPTVIAELGDDFEVTDAQRPAVEDPDLDEYLKDRMGFHRH
jgi:hypothetical protein